jgi:hypothetical protein
LIGLEISIGVTSALVVAWWWFVRQLWINNNRGRLW